MNHFLFLCINLRPACSYSKDKVIQANPGLRYEDIMMVTTAAITTGDYVKAEAMTKMEPNTTFTTYYSNAQTKFQDSSKML